jgi:hypothetical protein
MKITVKVGRKEGFDSSYNLFFENGLRLKTEDVTFLSREDRLTVQAKFREVVLALRTSGHEVTGWGDII